jgi:hypothetical protein
MKKPDPDELKGSGGLTLRQIHDQVKLSVARDQADNAQHESRQAVGRWQRLTHYFTHYLWGKDKGKS